MTEIKVPLTIEIVDHSLDPASSEIDIRVMGRSFSTGTEFRGRLMGPRCRYSSTVEVAYPFRPVPVHHEASRTLRVIIPEASFWDPESPFLYEGPLELWEAGKLCAQTSLSHGLRDLRKTPRGLFLNGRPLTLRIFPSARADEGELLTWRRRGANTLLTSSENSSLWTAADQLGFFVIGRVRNVDEALVRQIEKLSTHVSCLAWVFPAEMAQQPVWREVTSWFSARKQRFFLGIEVSDSVPGTCPPEASFVLGHDHNLTAVREWGLPEIVFGSAWDNGGENKVSSGTWGRIVSESDKPL